ncbi:MAG: hypothetical protein LBQ49_01805 [Rickettsiales bacterium]|nr:hypothetical protein [Rickettsiales bacterium]
MERKIRADALKKAQANRSELSKNAGWIGAAVGIVGGGLGGMLLGKHIDEKQLDEFVSANDVKEAKEALAGLELSIAAARNNVSTAASNGKACVPTGRPADEGVWTWSGLKNHYSESITIPNYKAGGNVNAETDKTCAAAGNKIDAAEAKVGAAKRALSGVKGKGAIGQEKYADDNGMAIGLGITGLIAGGLAGGLATQAIANDVYRMKAKREADEAVKAWFDNVGSKINCSVGSKPMGQYGDLLQL